MNTFQYQAREYVPRVDLQTLGSTFSTLQQGHEKAVQTASELQTAIASLDMNEAEDGFKQGLVQEVDDTIKLNAVYGNAYASLSKLIAKKGNLISDQRVLGRLRAQQDYKAYQTKVDNMAIPDGMKEMYKEENPYYYKDGVDDNGKITSTKWKAKTNPVTTVGRDKIAGYALQIAAKDAGGGESISFLDANGRPTSDPSKSETGEMYMKRGSKWERLSEDKIKSAYRQAIASIPGAEDSLRQDYKYALWKNKKGEAVDGIADKDGNIYTFEQWNNNQIAGLAKVASYNHVYSNVSLGTALQSRKTKEANAAAQAANDTTNGGHGSSLFAMKEVEVNAFADATNNKFKANQQAFALLSKGKGFNRGDMNSVHDLIQNAMKNGKGVTGPGSAANYYIAKYGKDWNNAQKQSFISAMMGYTQSNKIQSQMLKKTDDKDALMFSNDLANGTFSKNNKYSKDIVDKLNNIFADNDYVTYNVGSQVMQGLLAKYDNASVETLRQQGFDINDNGDGTYAVKFTGDNRNLLPKFDAFVREANNAVPGTLWSGIKRLVNIASKENFTISYSNKAPSNKVIEDPMKQGLGATAALSNKTLGELYNTAVDASAKIEAKAGVSKGYQSYNIIDAGSLDQMYYREHGQELGLTVDQQLKMEGDSNDRLDAMFATGGLDMAKIEYIDDKNMTNTDLNLNTEAKLLIQRMYQDDTLRKKVKRGVIAPTGRTAGGPIGYGIAFTVPKGMGTDHFKEGQTYRFAVTGFAKESMNYDPSYNPKGLANNAMFTSNTTGANPESIGTVLGVGNTTLSRRYKKVLAEDGTYVNVPVFDAVAFGQRRTLTAEQAEGFLADTYAMEQMKAKLQSRVFNNPDGSFNQDRYNAAVVALAKDMSINYGVSPEVAAYAINVYMLN